MKSESGRTLSRDTWVVAVPHHVSVPLGGEFAILNLGSGMYHGVEGVGARVWEIVSQATTVGAIEETLLREYDVDPDRLRRDLDQLLRGLLERGLLEVREGPPPASDAPE